MIMDTGIKVAEAMTQNPIFVDPDYSVIDCAKIMKEKAVGSLIVKKGEALLGIITERDLVIKVIAMGLGPKTVKAKDVMVEHVITIEPDVDLVEAIHLMRDHDIRHLPVSQGKKLLGLVTLKDIVKIEPQLFEILVEKIELREEANKPVNRPKPLEGVCNLCGEYAERLTDLSGQLVCDSCCEEETV